ncbi:GTPase [Embleya scabrispora]|uniref:GTPase n=1 Tax=Embleya scabrispora TaxID=159449 RepID=UPI00036FE136|nr:GTPase [Embleya scabrispora]MYS82451.1 ATP-binding protein [Streptomyces sp. SID5474]
MRLVVGERVTAGGQYVDRFAVRRARHASGTEESARLMARLAALDRTAALARDRLPGADLAFIEDLLGHAETRLGTATWHTVVALAGATGGGKSSLFNVLAGLRLADTGARRPTTRATLACAWDPEGAAPLLDLLGIEPVRRVARHGTLDARRGGAMPSGLVLLDLPEHDSLDLAHRAEVDSVVAVADHIVWVLDPQKYADVIVHERYLRPLRHHGHSMTVVLNHADRLPAGDLAACLTDVRALLATEGLAEVRVLATSAETGLGIAELRRVVVAAAGSGEASVTRLAADLDALTERLDPYFCGVAPGVDAFTDEDRGALVDGLCEAAGVAVVATSAGEGLRTPRGPLSGRRVRRPALPPGPVQVHRAEQAIRRAGTRLTRGLPAQWAGGVHRVLAEGLRGLSDELDAAPVGVVPEAARPTLGARVAVGAQWVGVVAVVVGLMGAGLAWTGVPVVRRLGVSGPWWVVAAGLVVVTLGGWVGRRATGAAVERRTAEVAAVLRARVAEAADRLVVGPAEAELARYREAHAYFVAAREPMRRG